jgi:Ca2+-transporting ATPase
VFARTSPEQKLRLVGAWKQQGKVVAMTGDRVNDAPALRQADIGVACGHDRHRRQQGSGRHDPGRRQLRHHRRRHREGRRIYDTIRRFVRSLLTTNSGEIWVMFLASVLALRVPLLPVQILWVDLVTDGLAAIALGLEPVERDAMRRPPRSPTESIFARGLWQHALWVGLTMAAVCLALLVGAVAVQLASLYLPALQRLFDTQALGPVQLVLVLVASTAAFFAVEIEKWVIRRRS